MWSHYSAQHEGLCVEFQRKNFNILGDNQHTLPIRYSNVYPNISAEDYAFKGNISDEEQKELRRTLIFTKANDWAYEREWRCIQKTGDEVHKINAEISGIIFGLKSSDGTKKKVAQLIQHSKKNIKMMEARLKHESFGVEIVTL